MGLVEIWNGLPLAKSLSIQNIHIELDASVLVQKISKDNCDSCSYYPIINDCRTIMRIFLTTTVKHVFREANCRADPLAKMGAEAEE